MKEYTLISTYYSSKVAARSNVPLINHIDEGLVILKHIGASSNAQRAWCVHPLLQNDECLKKNYHRVASSVNSYVMMFAMEYRSVANKHLSDKVGQPIQLSVIPEVNSMLIADKVQNCKDFLNYHKLTHPRSIELDAYFNEWLQALGVDVTKYSQLVGLL